MKKILYVLHSGVTGGTFLTNKDLMKNVNYNFDVFLLTAEVDVLKFYHYVNDKLVLIKEYERKYMWSAKDFHNNWLSYIYFDILNEYHIDIIHVRHLINHSFDLPKIAKKLDIPVVLSFHDFYFICPFYVLLNENNDYCGGVCNNNLDNCYNPLKSLDDINSKKLIELWRKNVFEMFQYVDYFVTTSSIVKNLFLKIYPNMNEEHFKVIEHGRDFLKFSKGCNEIPCENKPIKIVCPANHLNIMKGSELIKSIKKEDKNNRLEFHFLGNCHDGIENYGINHGTFERDEFFKKIEEIKPSFIGIFSIWPETFCHTLTEAWSCGIPVIGSNIGVIQDRIIKEKGGWLIDISNPKKAYDKIINIAEDKEEYTKVQENIKNISFKTTLEMSGEYLDVYNDLLF
ncbi:glycosyltransferase [uncultured Methanobrevibacter sp.]|uniref:glycosyltransferase n=1 Tax=uncultured Methanobrevibacter sp. TaxID=253161 RepID=UPI002632D954|nr:glycosyltransferase [uncultured Methanobrevibacter sp.]